MGWEPDSAKHRAAVLRLLEGMRKRGVPVDALGIQAHLGGGDPAIPMVLRQEADWRRFVDEVTAMGYDLVITELDVHENSLPGEVTQRDREVAAYAGTYLDFMLSYRQLSDVLVWGLSDHYSWLSGFRPRPDGLPKRPTPYDREYQPKPLRHAIADAFRRASTTYMPVRG
jgi:endo-1,4-beta-xylanase